MDETSVILRANLMTCVRAYTSIPTVREILVLHSSRVAADILRRGADGAWPEEPELWQEGDLVLTRIDARFSMSDLYAPTGLAA